MNRTSKQVALEKLKALNHEQGAKLLAENGYQLVGQHAYPQQQKSKNLKLYYYSEHQYQAWDNQAQPLDNKLYTAIYANIEDYIRRKQPVSAVWSSLNH